ncbi:MAG: type II and III secretion system protein family protein [Acidobacteriota bacterium]
MNLFFSSTRSIALAIAAFTAGTAGFAQSAPAMLAAAAGPSAVIPPLRMSIEKAGSNNSLHIVVGQSVILHDANAMRRIYVGNPAILQTFTSGPQEVVVTAKAAGSSSLVIWDTEEHSTMYNVHADLDSAALQQSLHDAFPHDAIQVQGNEDRINLTGSVATPEEVDSINKLAAQYTKDVVNSLRVVPIHGKQVELKLRIAEVDRTRLEQFGVNLVRSMGNVVGGTTTGMFPSTLTTTQGSGTTAPGVVANNPLNIFLFQFTHGYGATIQDLESHNVLQILAEPTLTTLSGKAANFLAGGEFPFPVVQPGGTGSAPIVTVQFRPYGVKVDFTPTANEDGTIHLKIAPEVSTLDYTNAVTISGITIPSLSTRRAQTEVEIRDGESFVISGLLNHSVTDQLSKIPGISNIPILGQLFRSKNLNHSTSELIIVVTATVVDPLKPSEPAVQNPKFVVPNLDQKKFDNEVDKVEKIQPGK